MMMVAAPGSLPAPCEGHCPHAAPLDLPSPSRGETAGRRRPRPMLAVYGPPAGDRAFDGPFPG
jgi:hypothetical protein